MFEENRARCRRQEEKKHEAAEATRSPAKRRKRAAGRQQGSAETAPCHPPPREKYAGRRMRVCQRFAQPPARPARRRAASAAMPQAAK